MTRDEVKQLLMRIQISYPNWKPSDLTLTVEVWHEMICEYEYADMLVALKAFVATDTSGFAPNIGQLISKAHTLKNGYTDGMSEAEAWSKVRNAISNSTYHSREEFERLPKAIQRAVGSADQLRVWAMDDEYNEGVTQSNFLRSYRIAKSREEEYNKLPSEIQQIVGIVSKSTTEQIESKD